MSIFIKIFSRNKKEAVPEMETTTSELLRESKELAAPQPIEKTEEQQE